LHDLIEDEDEDGKEGNGMANLSFCRSMQEQCTGLAEAGDHLVMGVRK